MRPVGWRRYVFDDDKPEDADYTNDGVRYANSIFLYRGHGGGAIVECKLEPYEMDKLEIFDVPPKHPAYPGRGVRAREALPSDTIVVSYAGVQRPGWFGDDNSYVFGVEPPELDLVIDAKRVGNIARFVNDPRGSMRTPNLTAEDDVYYHKTLRIRTILFRTTRPIEPGEELLLSYEASAADNNKYWKLNGAEIIDLTQEPDHKSFKREQKGQVENSNYKKNDGNDVNDNNGQKNDGQNNDGQNNDGQNNDGIAHVAHVAHVDANWARTHTLFSRLAQLEVHYTSVNAGSRNVLENALYQVLAQCVTHAIAEGEDEELPHDIPDLHIPSGFKRCTGCGAILPVNAKWFHRDKNLSSGYRGKCKKCHSKKGTKLTEKTWNFNENNAEANLTIPRMVRVTTKATPDFLDNESGLSEENESLRKRRKEDNRDEDDAKDGDDEPISNGNGNSDSNSKSNSNGDNDNNNDSNSDVDDSAHNKPSTHFPSESGAARGHPKLAPSHGTTAAQALNIYKSRKDNPIPVYARLLTCFESVTKFVTLNGQKDSLWALLPDISGLNWDANDVAYEIKKHLKASGPASFRGAKKSAQDVRTKEGVQFGFAYLHLVAWHADFYVAQTKCGWGLFARRDLTYAEVQANLYGFMTPVDDCVYDELQAAGHPSLFAVGKSRYILHELLSLANHQCDSNVRQRVLSELDLTQF